MNTKQWDSDQPCGGGAMRGQMAGGEPSLGVREGEGDRAGWRAVPREDDYYFTISHSDINHNC